MRNLNLVLIAGFICAWILYEFTQIYIGFILFSLLAYVLILIYLFRKNIEQKLEFQERNFTSTMRMFTSDSKLKSKQLITVMDNIPLPFALIDSYGNIVMHNNMFNHFIRKQDVKQLRYDDARLIDDVRIFVKEAYLNEKKLLKFINFNSVDYQALSVPIIEESRFSGCVLVFQDVTDAYEKERIQKRFIADASHELKTPITAILGMVEILNREGFDDHQTRKEFLSDIEVEIKRLSNIVQDLLKLSKLASNKVNLNLKRVNIANMIQEIVTTLKPVANKKNIAFNFEYENEAYVEVDEMKMHSAFSNIIDNAIKYTDKGSINIKIYHKNDMLIIEVKDTGIGIKKEDLDHIFERFYRPDTDRSRITGGTGLGLSIVKSTMDLHGATISVTSNEKEGSCFKISIKS